MSGTYGVIWVDINQVKIGVDSVEFRLLDGDDGWFVSVYIDGKQSGYLNREKNALDGWKTAGECLESLRQFCRDNIKMEHVSKITIQPLSFFGGK